MLGLHGAMVRSCKVAIPYAGNENALCTCIGPKWLKFSKFLRKLKKLFFHLEISVVVRGKYVVISNIFS